MPHDDRAQGAPPQSPHTVAFVTAGPASDPSFMSYSCDTTQVDISAMELSTVIVPVDARDSTDDLFASEYQMVLGDRPTGFVRTVEELQGMVHHLMMSGDRYSFGGADDGSGGVLELRTCSQYINRNQKLVGWMSYRDTNSEAFVIPNLALLERSGEGAHTSEVPDSERYERFFEGEARVLLIAGAEEGSIGVFATPQCEREMVEHFLVALRGGAQASFLNYLWQREFERYLGAHGVDMEGDARLHVFRDEVVVRCLSCNDGDGGSSVDLEVSLRDPDNTLFSEVFGSKNIICRMILAPQTSSSWRRPSFEWR
jgi:hypothetical protein